MGLLSEYLFHIKAHYNLSFISVRLNGFGGYLSAGNVLRDFVDSVQQPLDGAGNLLDGLKEGPTVRYLVGNPIKPIG